MDFVPDLRVCILMLPPGCCPRQDMVILGSEKEKKILLRNRGYIWSYLCFTATAFVSFILITGLMNGTQDRQLTSVEHSRAPSECQPVNYIFFLKTHKTGSSTLANILYRYGDNKDLTHVLPKGSISFDWPELFNLSATIPLYAEEGKILASHTRYNKGPVNLLFPKIKSKYITIIRHPISQFESVFNYFHMSKKIVGHKNESYSMQSYLRNPAEVRDRPLVRLLRNPSLYDLGFNRKYFEYRKVVLQYINFIEDEFDLVLINEYFDESLILLKKMLCWDLEDILYVKQKVRMERESLDDPIKANILSWSQADLLLYNHFNQTLWRKISEAGPEFHEELQLFRDRNKIVQEPCLRELEKGALELENVENYPGKYLQMCVQMTRNTTSYLAYTKKRMERKWEAVDNSYFGENYNVSEKSWNKRQDLKYKPVLLPEDSQ